MTGEEWLKIVRSMKHIDFIRWEFTDDFDGIGIFDRAFLIVKADKKLHRIEIAHSINNDPVLKIYGMEHEITWMQAVSICLVINRFMEQLGLSERFGVSESEVDLHYMTDVINTGVSISKRKDQV